MRKTGRVERDVTVVTQPPSVSVDSEQHYLYLGMADLATFNVSGQLHRGGRARRRPDVSRMAHAGRQAGNVFAVRVCLEHAAGHGSDGLRLERCRERRDQPARGHLPEEGAAALHRRTTCRSATPSCRRWLANLIRTARATWSRASSRSTPKCARRTTRRSPICV